MPRPMYRPSRRRQGGWFVIDPFTGGGSGAGNDPYFSFVVQLAHFDGVNGATSYASTVPAVGGNFAQQGAGCVLSTTQIKFGSTSLRLVTNYVKAPSSATYAIGSAADFVIEAFQWWDSTSGTQVIFDMRGANPDVAPAMYSNGTTLNYQYATTTAITSAASAISSGAWMYIAVARASGTTRLYGGSASGSTVPLLGSFSDSQNYVQAGINWAASFLGTSKLAGYVDDIRFTNGHARGYTGATIAVPTSALPNS